MIYNNNDALGGITVRALRSCRELYLRFYCDFIV